MLCIPYWLLFAFCLGSSWIAFMVGFAIYVAIKEHEKMDNKP